MTIKHSGATEAIPPARRAAAAARRLRRRERALLIYPTVASAVLLVPALFAGTARARSLADLIEVNVRPRCNFPNARAALVSGQGLCDKVSRARLDADRMAGGRADFHTGDDYPAAYLNDRAVNELRPAQIWHRRNAAAHDQPPSP